ncbi:alpha/beta hydrolase fold domain-containing protein [Streptomyces chartreusis]|uniref:alpha/beta hydrolase fold domain-containing protein n=1 Tax=Streptomyces chartreusis TaxID=1969 RepID=UPI00363881B6
MIHDQKYPPLNPQFHELFWRDVPSGEISAYVKPYTVEDVVARRADLDAHLISDEELTQGGAVSFEERTVPGYEGGPEVPILILRPRDAVGARPGLLLTNCAGKMTSHPRMIKGLGFVEWVAKHQIVLVVNGMRTAPEDPHPAQVHDSYAALCWVAAQHESLGLDPDRLGLLGVSGGGGVAAATALYARDHGGPSLSNLIVLSPMLDDRDITVSNWFERVPHPHDANHMAWTAMLGDAKGGPLVDAYAAPSRATTLRGLPPMYIETGSADIFRDESLEFAMRAGQAGVPVEVHSWAGLVHSGETIAPGLDLSRMVLAARDGYLQRFGSPAGGLVPNVHPDELKQS